VGQYNQTSRRNPVVFAQNNYAHHQKQNPHTPRVMKTLGLDSDDVDSFIKKCLFPEVKWSFMIDYTAFKVKINHKWLVDIAVLVML